jgi:hypothetical protein
MRNERRPIASGPTEKPHCSEILKHQTRDKE